MTTIGPQHLPTEWVPRLAMLAGDLRPDWDVPGIRAALAKVADRPLIDVAAATIAACHRIDQRTPAIIAMQGAHWPDPTNAQHTYHEPGIVTWCEHGRPSSLHCDYCAAPVERTGPTADQRAAIRAALNAAKTPPNANSR